MGDRLMTYELCHIGKHQRISCVFYLTSYDWQICRILKTESIDDRLMSNDLLNK